MGIEEVITLTQNIITMCAAWGFRLTNFISNSSDVLAPGIDLNRKGLVLRTKTCY